MAGNVLVLRDAAGQEHAVEVGADGAVNAGGLTLSTSVAPDGSVLVQGPTTALAWTAVVGDTRWVFVDGEVFTFDVARAAANRRKPPTHHAALTAPMPATVRTLLVNGGDEVRAGDVLIVLEAMKMELPVRAPADGRVAEINCREGDLVQPGVTLIELDD